MQQPATGTGQQQLANDMAELAITDDKAHPAKTVYYTSERVVGNGSFGVVFQAVVAGTNEVVAIKKVLQDRKFKNRELQIMRMLEHPNIVKLKHCFYSNGESGDKVYLNLVLEYVPQTVYKVCRYYAKQRRTLPVFYVKLYSYQLCRSLAYLHACGICHRDIKPQNLLVDPATGVLKLCDFGSSKMLKPGEPSVAYICSRYYRAPELVFGTTLYTCAIDIWSMGCVIAEMLLGQPLFPGIDQLVEIIKVIGSPTQAELKSMNQNYLDFKFPVVRAHPWVKVFRQHTDRLAIDLVSKLLVYSPNQRLTAAQALAHPFFHELRQPGCRMPDGKPLPPLFNFNQTEIASNPELFRTLVPEHLRSTFVMPPPPTAPVPPPPSPPPAGASPPAGTATVVVVADPRHAAASGSTAPASAVSLPVLAPSSSQVDAPPTVAEAHPPEGGPPSAAAVAAAAAFAGPLPGSASAVAPSAALPSVSTASIEAVQPSQPGGI